MSKISLIIVCFCLIPAVLAQKQKFQINGSARTYIFSNNLDIDDNIDTTTTRKANYGHSLLDFGVSAFPNKNTEVIGMFRIRNELGGFWGGGVSFNVRQLTLKGVAGDIVRYELGDIDIKQTPYTVWNFAEEGNINEADIFASRRQVVHYDMFYNDSTNAWRMQGAQAKFGLNFNKGVKAINFHGFMTRQKTTDGLTTPERMFGGGKIGIDASENLSIIFNSANIFDLTETIADSLQFKNSVHTASIEYKNDLKDSLEFGFNSEMGLSSTNYINYQDTRAPEALSDWFVDANIYTNLKNKGIIVKLGYKDIGADFRSPSAQTKRIDYSKFPRVYQQFTNNSLGRVLSYADFISGNTDNSFKISEELLPYYAAYNNTNPYGAATPNRRGIYLNLARKDSIAFKTSFIKFAGLTESVGTGTLQKKIFLLAEAGTDLYLNDLFKWNRILKLDLGMRYENTTRTGKEYENIQLASTFIDLGLSWEIAEKLDILAGAKLWSVSGNAFMNERNIFNSIDDFEIVDLNFKENVLAAGLQYRFSEKNIFSLHYQQFNINHGDDAMIDYGMSQFTILYNLFF